MRDPEQTLMELRMTSLLPAQAVADLEEHFGAKFASLSPIEHLTLVTAATEGMVNHGRLREISTDHPTDLTKMLTRLVKDGLLVSDGVGRGTLYFLPWQDRQGSSLFETEVAQPTAQGGVPPELSAIPPELPTLYLEWSQLSDELQHELKVIAQAVCVHPRVTSDVLRTTILKLCQGRYLSRRVLAQLLSRNQDDLLKRTLNPLVDANLLKAAFPSSSDPRQAYTTCNNVGKSA